MDGLNSVRVSNVVKQVFALPPPLSPSPFNTGTSIYPVSEKVIGATANLSLVICIKEEKVLKRIIYYMQAFFL